MENTCLIWSCNAQSRYRTCSPNLGQRELEFSGVKTQCGDGAYEPFMSESQSSIFAPPEPKILAMTGRTIHFLKAHPAAWPCPATGRQQSASAWHSSSSCRSRFISEGIKPAYFLRQL
ncbi:hypothetical protein AGR4C_Lc90015 [Agrobacterium tumefaciens str. Kerr 14]|uniref:Uncharacterized protein n=1 Tax=Agrobacterium tumefaciens str. Kerr 14 TaxID=1183424 RepID=A0A1S7S534_AGRTU|nr:hypothetical protein AGR4C_Lc90015 [Agrobacterium tumefaciens str. Kerr 14]